MLFRSGGFVDNLFPQYPWSEHLPFTEAYPSLSEVAYLNFATYPNSPEHLLRVGNLAAHPYRGEQVGGTSLPPGHYYRYSSYGYLMLGWVIEGASCRGYESFVREFVLKPIGALNTEIADSDLKLRKVGEVPYYSELWPWQGDMGNAVMWEGR